MAHPRHSLPRVSIVSIKSAIQHVARFRWLIFIIGNMANFANNMVVSSLSLTIVAMIEKDEQKLINSTLLLNTSNITNSTLVDVLIEPIEHPSIHVDWTNVDKDRMLQAAFWGTLVMSVFGGRICELFGPRRVVALALATSGLVNLAFPETARRSFYGAYVARIVQGLCTGIIQPSTFVVVSRWSTAYERTLSNAVVSSGGSLGNLISLPLAGVLVSSSFLGGWPSVFYIMGAFIFIIAIVWFFVIYDTPEEHPRLSPEELEEILSKRSLKSGDPVEVPWGQMFTSLPVYAYLIPSFTYGWVVAVVINQIPSFYEEILDFSHEANGFMASLPWLVSMGSSLIGSTIADKIRRTNRFTLTSIRKVFTAIGLGCVSIGLFVITLLEKRRIAVVLTLAISKGMGTLSTAGYNANHLDIAPSFAGTLAGFSGMLTSLASLAANEGAARIVGNEPTQKNWYRFFYISAAINAAGTILYCLMASGETMSWDPSSVRRESIKSQNSKKSRTFSSKSDKSRDGEHNDYRFQLPQSHQQQTHQKQFKDQHKDQHITEAIVSTIQLESEN